MEHKYLLILTCPVNAAKVPAIGLQRDFRQPVCEPDESLRRTVRFVVSAGVNECELFVTSPLPASEFTPTVIPATV
jgi:hypothetical protein